MFAKRKLLAAVAMIATTSALVFSGLTFASATNTGKGSRIEHFQLVLNSVTSLPVTQIPVIAYGPVTDYGTNNILNASTAVFNLQQGTINLANIVIKQSKQDVNPVTCLSIAVQRGTYSITGGTGAYVGIHGHGTFHLRIIAIFSRDSTGKCSGTIPPQSIQLLDTVSGPIML